MNAFRGLLLCLALALAGAFAWGALASDPGQVIVSLHGTVYITTVSKLLVLLVVASLALWALVMLVRWPWRLWHRHRHAQALARMSGGLMALHEGRWARAEKLLAQASGSAAMRAPARLAAAQAALARGDADASEHHLTAVGEAKDDPAAALSRAQYELDAGQPQAALARLDAAARQGPPPPRALLLRVRALLADARASEAWGMLGAIRNAQVLAAPELAALEADCARQMLAEAADANVLADLRDHLPVALRNQPRIVAAYVQRATALGLVDAAAGAIQAVLADTWDEALVREYAQLPPGRTTPDARLKLAASWLPGHADSPALALALGRLHAGLQQWGKAEDQLQRAIALGAGAAAWEVLGDVHAIRGDTANAMSCFRNALRAARGEALTPLAGRSLRERTLDAEVIEERDDNGVPRLPARPS